MKFLEIVSLLLLSATANAAVDGLCSVNGTSGVCISTANCASGGGKSTVGFCPNDPADIRCCTKTACGSGGNCRWTNECSGTSVSNQCPGPGGFKCCQPSSGGSIPTIPANKCKPHVVSNGYIILNQFPGKVHTVWCYANKPGDHGTGTALDLMVQDRNIIGQTIAEWTMNNHARLMVKYIIWGQKIWNVEVDKTPRAWSQWRAMEDRGSDTANHWDHTHISFLPA
ncbi:hypothetical protein L873DRAFT_1817221 [Choiromyces venosus 120613-1]|uniref:ARB-07466-like C-terminal domain-containing protein n=1 Tax=Choiromyces venosus 120613-1 TaxID=1336337 RepID=A0A3N4J319_9PEZI|nr:hypothetical protein L873DRAFT_1817221 [Choiromyces venosus 120613-1]